MSGFLARGQERAKAYLHEGIETWFSEGRISREEADALESTILTPEVAAGLFHFGVHFAISLPLRSPLGSIARFFYTLGLRLKAELGRFLGGGKPDAARRLHTVPVMLVALVPGFGRLGYLFSANLAGERLLLFIPLDITSRKLPFRLYHRLHLDSIFTYWAVGQPHEPNWRRILSWRTVRYSIENLRALRPYALPLTAALAFNGLALSIGAYLYVQAGQPEGNPIFWWFAERSIMPTINVAQLLIAAFFGFAAFRAFWERPEAATLRDAAGIALWAAGGVGLLVFAFDDYFTVHETLGDTVIEWIGFVPFKVNDLGDFLIIGYAVVGVITLFLFRMELLSHRPSAVLMQLAGATAVLMTLIDAFAWDRTMEALEYPAQSAACCLLMFAFYSRYREVRESIRAASTPAERQAVEVGG